MNPNHEEALFQLALARLAVAQTSVNPKQALRRWTNARRRAVPTL
jgi:hypothetical protein